IRSLRDEEHGLGPVNRHVESRPPSTPIGGDGIRGPHIALPARFAALRRTRPLLEFRNGASWLWRLLRPPRTIWPTRDGVWCLLVVMGLGVAAINTGNNLLYLLVSLLLALIIMSGVLSEQSLRRLDLTAMDPEEIYAGRPALFGMTVANRKRWLT